MSKPDLPGLPYSLLETLNGEEINEVRAYAEEVVRQALEAAAVKIGELSQKAFEQPEISGAVQWAYHQAIVTILTNPPEPRDG